jgi:hypothetical protein
VDGADLLIWQRNLGSSTAAVESGESLTMAALDAAYAELAQRQAYTETFSRSPFNWRRFQVVQSGQPQLVHRVTPIEPHSYERQFGTHWSNDSPSVGGLEDLLYDDSDYWADAPFMDAAHHAETLEL